MFQQRLNYGKIAPEARSAVMALNAYVHESGLETELIELVKIRASQINQCAFCIDKHSKDARRMGETTQRVDLLAAWHESPIYTPRERSALAWTEALTRLSIDGAPDALFHELTKHFTDKEIVNLTVLVGHINLLNRIGVGFRLQHPVSVRVAGVASGA